MNAARSGGCAPPTTAIASSAFDRAPDFGADPLYVVGGLYGNLAALDEVERLAAEEGAQIVFNGDFHWFDAERGWFAEIDARVARHLAIRGNVETEIARPTDIGAGCGCAYPASVAEDVVRRSNEILIDLRQTAATFPGAAARSGRSTDAPCCGGRPSSRRHRAWRRHRARRLDLRA